MAYQQYPTYGAQPRTRFNPTRPSTTASNQANPWNASEWRTGTQPNQNPYGQARGGGQYTRPYPSGYQGEPGVRQPVPRDPHIPAPYQNQPNTPNGQNGGYQPPPAWNPHEVTTQPVRPGQQSTYTPWTPTGLPMDPSGWNTQALRDQYSQYMATMLPYQQYQQNNQQYSQDFNEAQRRWDEQFGWTQQGDLFNQNLSQRQQQMAEWQATEAARQWGEQFGWQQQSDLFGQDLANRQLSQQGDLQRQQMSIEQAYNEGRLSNEQRQLALSELSQRQDEVFRREQLASQMGWNREELASRDALARWQQQQQAVMQQQQLDAARQNAILQATGRNQMPNTLWMRRS